ncbi:MAG TPA: molybdate ABC transporter substrate-binding protein [Glaciibacter sp.]|nr:molybdate ABC transporter substrate-binding protein [Glaciibacter sp.]
MRGAWVRMATVLTVPLLGALVGCSAPTAAGGSGASDKSASITVFAAASLQHIFTDLAAWFESEHPGTSVQLSFAGSSDLAAQILAGAPADIFASADERTMTALVGEERVRDTPLAFATNRMQIAVPPGNPARIGSLADLAREDVLTVICAPQVPCGAATKDAERIAGIRLKPVSEEMSVTDVLGKVASGEADAGLVYVTDVLSSEGRVIGVSFPESQQVVNTYTIAELAGSSNRAAAQEFIAAVTGEKGQSVLHAAGFGPPG